MKKIGVLSLQGGFARHLETIKKTGNIPVAVRDELSLAECEALILPGGESTTIAMLIKRRGLHKAIQERIDSGMPIFGTCAGMILLSSKISGRSELHFSALEISVQRNAYGSQIESFEATIDIHGKSLHIENFPAIFIRAPRIESLDGEIEILSSFNEHPILIQKNNILASSFHPELTDDSRIHEYFISLIP